MTNEYIDYSGPPLFTEYQGIEDNINMNKFALLQGYTEKMTTMTQKRSKQHAILLTTKSVTT